MGFETDERREMGDGRAVAALLVLAHLALSGATVPQDSIEKYYFSRPNCTNVSGTVIGEPPAYSTLRREDIAWLREAACERAALASRTWRGLSSNVTLAASIGRFPLSTTNDFHTSFTAKEWIAGSLQTNVVVGYNYVTNIGAGIDRVRSASTDPAAGLSFGSGFSGWLAPTGTVWLSGSASQTGSFPSHTNVIVTVETNYPSFIWDDHGIRPNVTTRVEVITMEMTNGTTSAWTNTWRETLPYVETTTVTNISSGSAAGLLFADRQIVPYAAPIPKPFSGIPRLSTVTNWYGWLRGMSVLAEAVSNTNMLRNVVHRWRYDYGDEKWKMRPETRTNETYLVGLFARGVVIDIIAEGEASGNGRLVFPTSFDWDLVHTGGVCRIASADLYACVDATFSSGMYSSYASPTNIYGTFVKRLGTASKIAAPQGGKVCFEASVDGPAIAREGAAAIGCPVLSTWNGWGDDRAAYGVTFFLVFHMAPYASLPGWNN